VEREMHELEVKKGQGKLDKNMQGGRGKKEGRDRGESLF
jgi:hypothetical protein